MTAAAPPTGPRAMDEATRQLLDDLRASRTDLAKLVEAVLRSGTAHVAVAAPAIERWEREDPRGWHAVRAWLVARGVLVVVV